MFRSCCNRIRNFSTQNRKDHSLANIDIVFSNQRFAAGTTNMYFMLKSLVTHQLLQSVTNLYLVWGVWHMSEFLVSPCFPYFLKSCISSKRQGKQTCIYFLSTIKKYSLDVATLGQIQENKHVPYTGPPIICEHGFFHAKPLTCTFCYPRRRSESAKVMVKRKILHRGKYMLASYMHVLDLQWDTG